MYHTISKNGFVTPVDVLIEVEVLSKIDYENWRNGRVPYLEKVCKVNLHKLATIMKEMRSYAKMHNLKPSYTAYYKWGKGKKIKLRFSISGDENIECSYSTHFVDSKKIAELKATKQKPNENITT